MDSNMFMVGPCVLVGFSIIENGVFVPGFSPVNIIGPC